MICNTCPYIDNINENDNNPYCAKLDCKILNIEPCEKEDAVKKKIPQKPRKWCKYERKKRYRNKLERILKADKYYPSGAYRVGYDGWFTDDPNNTKYIKRYYRTNHAPGYSGYLKKLANRKFRRYKEILANGCAYKKIFDYWWELT